MSTYNLVLLGGGGVGKSCLSCRFMFDHFAEFYDPTIEDAYRCQRKVDDEVALLDILDTAGQEDYSAMRDQYIRTGEGFLLVYSITSRSSFEEVEDIYEHILRAKDTDKAPVVLVATKCDLEKLRQVATDEGEHFAKSRGIPFLETSSLQDVNVNEAFFTLVRETRAARDSASSAKPEKKKKKKCTIL